MKGKTILISSHILSEISLLADDIGIIDNGILLEESTMKELEEKNEKYIHFSITMAAQAARILTVDFGTKEFKVIDEHNIYLYDTSLSVASINRKFIENGIDVLESHLCEDTLEDYFKRVTGGSGIA